MVNGIEAFRDCFAEYTDQYVIIGGFACDLLMSDAGLDFRQTKDIDMVIIIEALTEKFAARFWNYIKAGGYKPYVGSHGESEFYRFVEPISRMLEVMGNQNFTVLLNRQVLTIHL